MKSGKKAWGPINLKLRSRRGATKGCWQQGSGARKQGHAAAAPTPPPPPFKGFTHKKKERTCAFVFPTLNCGLFTSTQVIDKSQEANILHIYRQIDEEEQRLYPSLTGWFKS